MRYEITYGPGTLGGLKSHRLLNKKPWILSLEVLFQLQAVLIT